jgi:hypothetical protein
MQPLALAGGVTAKSESAVIAHAMVLVMFFSEKSVERLHNAIRPGKFRHGQASAGGSSTQVGNDPSSWT